MYMSNIALHLAVAFSFTRLCAVDWFPISTDHIIYNIYSQKMNDFNLRKINIHKMFKSEMNAKLRHEDQ